MQQLPIKVSLYLRENFDDALIVDISEQKTISGSVIYIVGLECHDVFYLLEFNEKGDLTRYDSREIYGQDL